MPIAMLKGPGLKATLTILLVGAAVFASTSPAGGHWELKVPMISFLLLFGIINVFLAVPGTTSLRFFAIASTLATLLWPQYLGLLSTLAILIVWPIWILVAWAVTLAEVSGDDVAGDEDANDRMTTDQNDRRRKFKTKDRRGA